MKLIRVQMSKTRDQLQAGQFYNLPRLTATWLIEQGYARGLDNQLVGPLEIKPVAPAEIKVKKKSKRAQTAKGF